jgi:hypothetical protein
VFAAGQIVEVSAIKIAYDKAIGRFLDNVLDQIYHMLQHHEWCNIILCIKHPNKASDEAIEVSKN